MNEIKEKFKYFNAFVSGLLERYEESGLDVQNNDLSKLKILKLLFLSVAKDGDSLDIFDNFVARDLGPVEKDIYDEIDSGCKNLMFNIDNKSTQPKSGIIKVDDKYTKFAKERIDFLKRKNPTLISRKASHLVDITHKRDCRIMIRIISKQINKDKRMGKSIILMSNGYYY